MIFPSINNLLKDASQSFLRFPITILSSVITAFVLIYMVEHEFSPEQHIVLFNMALVAMLHIGFSFGLYLFAEKEQFSISKKYLLQVVALILLIFYYLCLPNQILREIPFQPYVQYILFGLATHFFIAFLPYLKRDLTISLFSAKSAN